MSKGRLPPVLLPYQQAWVSDPAQVKVYEKSRRIGISWAEAADSALTAATAADAGGMDVWYIGYNREMAQEFVGDVADWAGHFDAAASEIGEEIWQDDEADQQILTYVVRFPRSGFRVTALSSRPSNLRGKQGKVVIDEAAFHEQLEELLKAAFALLIWGGRVAVISTHNGEENPFNLFCAEVRAGKRPYRLHRTAFREAVAAGLYRRICLVKGIAWSRDKEQAWAEAIYDQYGDAAAEELDVVPSRGAGLYFSRIVLEQCMTDGVPIVRWAKPDEFVLDQTRLAETARWCEEALGPVLDGLPTDQRSVYAQDFARSGDLSPIRVFQEDRPRHWAERLLLDLRNIPFDCQALVWDYLLDRLPLLHGAGFDARGNGAAHAEAAQQKYGLRVMLVKATPEWYATYFPRYRAAHEDRSISIARSEDLIADHRLVELHKGKPRMAEGRIKGSDGQYRHGDTASAGVIAWAVILEEGEPAYGEDIAPDMGAYAPEAVLFGRGSKRQ